MRRAAAYNKRREETAIGLAIWATHCDGRTEKNDATEDLLLLQRNGSGLWFDRHSEVSSERIFLFRTFPFD